MKSTEVIKVESNKKETVLQLDVVLETPKKIENIEPIKSEIIKNSVEKEIIKKAASTSVKKRTNLKSLFANVKTTAKKVEKSKVLNIKKNKVSSRFKSKFEKEKKVNVLKLSKLSQNNNKTKQQIVKQSKSSDKKSDPYFNKINQIVHEGWNPLIYNKKAIVIVTISNRGRFSYVIKKYSNSIEFDNQLKDYLDAESLKKYPISPTNKTVTIEITFKSEG
ncbi:MAG: TonB C-terminal domain-containing protein [Campylobacterota bacterium]|nr:TonB C-terminal domain-containing protein [Campylobacterota bacterium]